MPRPLARTASLTAASAAGAPSMRNASEVRGSPHTSRSRLPAAANEWSDASGMETAPRAFSETILPEVTCSTAPSQENVPSMVSPPTRSTPLIPGPLLRDVERHRDAGVLPLLVPLMAASSVFVMGGAVYMASGVLAGVYSEGLLELATGTPKFDYGIGGGESGNATFGVYAQMRLLSAAGLGCAVVLGAAARVLGGFDARASGRAASAMAARPLAVLVLLAAFPAAWDAASDMSEYASLWILNPSYTFESDAPCPPEWYRTGSVLEEYDSSPYATGSHAGDAEIAGDVCRPGLRVDYLVSQAVVHTEYAPGDALDLAAGVASGAEGLAADALFLMARAVAASVLVLGTMTALVITDVFAGVAIASLPLFAALSMVPRFSAVSGRFLESLPAILLLPVVTSGVIVAGSSFVAGASEGGGTVPEAAPGVTYAWAAAVGTLYLVAILPVATVALVSGVVRHAAGAVREAVGAASSAAARGRPGG